MSAYQTSLSDDRASLALSIGEDASVTLSAKELDGLIKQLVKERRKMMPMLPQPDISTMVVNQGKSLRVEISGYPEAQSCNLTASELEAWMEDLMEQRFVLSPPIPNEDPPKGTKYISRSGRRWWVEPDHDKGRVTVALQHAGLGWIWISLTRANAEGFVSLLQKAAETLPG